MARKLSPAQIEFMRCVRDLGRPPSRFQYQTENRLTEGGYIEFAQFRFVNGEYGFEWRLTPKGREYVDARL